MNARKKELVLVILNAQILEKKSSCLFNNKVCITKDNIYIEYLSEMLRIAPTYNIYERYIGNRYLNKYGSDFESLKRKSTHELEEILQDKINQNLIPTVTSISKKKKRLYELLARYAYYHNEYPVRYGLVMFFVATPFFGMMFATLVLIMMTFDKGIGTKIGEGIPTVLLIDLVMFIIWVLSMYRLTRKSKYEIVKVKRK